MSKRKAQAGYTMIEIVMAMGVMTVGAMGLMALQTAAAGGNMESRKMTTAASITRLWIDRLQRDALRWNVGGAVTTADLSQTQYLNLTPAAGAESAWFTPVPAPGSGESYAFDLYGSDVLNGVANPNGAVFCVQTRLQWMFANQAIRADMRVWWHRSSRSADAQMSDRRLYANCGLGQEAAAAADRRLRFISTSTILRRNPL